MYVLGFSSTGTVFSLLSVCCVLRCMACVNPAIFFVPCFLSQHALIKIRNLTKDKEYRGESNNEDHCCIINQQPDGRPDISFFLPPLRLLRWTHVQTV